MDKSSAALRVGPLIGSQFGDEHRARPGWIDELMIDLDPGHAKNVVLSVGDMPKSGNAAGAFPGEGLRPEPRNSTAKQTSNEHLDSGRGKPDKENTFFVYTYSVARAR